MELTSVLFKTITLKTQQWAASPKLPMTVLFRYRMQGKYNEVLREGTAQLDRTDGTAGQD